MAGAGTYLPFGPVKSAPFKLGIPRADQRGLNSRTRTFKQPLDHVAEFSIESPLQTDSNWLMIQSFDDSPLKHYSVLVKVVIGATTYRVYGMGVYLEEVKVSTARNEPIITNLNFDVGRWNGVHTSKQYTETDVTESTTVPQVWKDGKVAIVSGFSDTGNLDMVDSWDITFKNNYSKRGSWSTLYPRDSQEQGIDVTGSVTLDLEDLDQLSALLAEETGVIDFFTEATDKITATGVSFDSVDIDFEEISLIQQTIPFTADSISFTT